MTKNYFIFYIGRRLESLPFSDLKCLGPVCPLPPWLGPVCLSLRAVPTALALPVRLDRPTRPSLTLVEAPSWMRARQCAKGEYRSRHLRMRQSASSLHLGSGAAMAIGLSRVRQTFLYLGEGVFPTIAPFSSHLLFFFLFIHLCFSLASFQRFLLGFFESFKFFFQANLRSYSKGSNLRLFLDFLSLIMVRFLLGKMPRINVPWR